VLTDVSGATATEYCLIAAGVGFAVTLAMLPHRASRLLYAFDLMELDGDDLRSLPIETRKATLASPQSGRDPIERAHLGGRAGGVRPRLPARGRGNRIEAARLALPLGPVRRLDQVQESFGVCS
jgi:hypothetical protein